jgi:TPR repeat protein
LQLLRPLADGGNAQAQTPIGTLYGEGLGVQKDDAKALNWIGKSNEQGNVGGQSMPADAYGRAEEFDRVREVVLSSR